MRLLTSRSLPVRVVSLWIIGVIIMFIAWDLSYRSLPEGAARGKLLISYVKIDTVKVTVTFTQIFFYNLFLAGMPITIANLVRLKTLPVGYLLSFYHWIMYGIFLGTNSFLFPSTFKLTPTLQIFSSTAVYEITAYTIIAASTCEITAYYTPSTEKRRLRWRLGGITRTELASFISGIIILALSNYVEALQIVRLQ